MYANHKVALGSQGTKLSFNLTTGPQFSFSLHTTELDTSAMAEKVKRCLMPEGIKGGIKNC